MYLYKIISDLEASKHGVHIDKFVVAENAKQARQLVADNIQLPHAIMNHLLSIGYNLERFVQSDRMAGLRRYSIWVNNSKKELYTFDLIVTNPDGTIQLVDDHIFKAKYKEINYE